MANLVQGEDIQHVLQGVDHQGAQLQRHEGGHAAEELLDGHRGHLLAVGDEGQPQVLVGVEERRAPGQPPAGERQGWIGLVGGDSDPQVLQALTAGAARPGLLHTASGQSLRTATGRGGGWPRRGPPV